MTNEELRTLNKTRHIQQIAWRERNLGCGLVDVLRMIPGASGFAATKTRRPVEPSIGPIPAACAHPRSAGRCLNGPALPSPHGEGRPHDGCEFADTNAT